MSAKWTSVVLACTALLLVQNTPFLLGAIHSTDIFIAGSSGRVSCTLLQSKAHDSDLALELCFPSIS